MSLPSIPPEYQSLETFVEFCFEEDCFTFTYEDLQVLAVSLQRSHHKVRLDLEDYGFTLLYREREKEPRGFNSNDHDRWYGKGAERTHGGSGWEQINGFAGREG